MPKGPERMNSVKIGIRPVFANSPTHLKFGSAINCLNEKIGAPYVFHVAHPISSIATEKKASAKPVVTNALKPQ